MNIQVVPIVAGAAFIVGAVISIREKAVGYKDGYKLKRERGPFGYWAAVVSITVCGLLSIAFGLGYLQ